MKRRDFLGRVAGATGLAAVGGLRFDRHSGSVNSRIAVHDSGLTVPDSLSRIGLELYTVRDRMKESVERTLEQVARIGYKEVEFAGYFDRSAKVIRALLASNGLTSPSAHSASMSAIRNRFPQVLEEAKVIGHQFVICASLPRSEITGADGFRKVAEEFNRAGAAAAEAGITFGFHNHAEVFAPLGGTTGYDILLSECDPKLVTMQLDLYWTRKAGHDPLQYFAKHPGRFSSVHVKDMDAAGAMVDVGAGLLPFGRYFAQAPQAGIRHFFVENDDPPDPMASITASYRHLAALKF